MDDDQEQHIDIQQWGNLANQEGDPVIDMMA